MDGIILAMLLLATGSPHWPQRELATNQLRAFLPASASVIKWGRCSKDLEIATRCKTLWREYVSTTARAKAEQTLPRWYAERPWVDTLPKDYPDRASTIEYYLEQARDKTGRGGPPLWSDYRLATLLLVERLYKDEIGTEAIQDLLDQMARREWKWIAENGKNYNPQIPVPWDKLQGW